MHGRRARSQYGFCKFSAYLKKSYYLRGTELPLPCVAVWKGNLARREKKGPCTPGHPRSVTVPALYFRPSIRRASSFDIIESAGAYTDITNASMSCSRRVCSWCHCSATFDSAHTHVQYGRCILDNIDRLPSSPNQEWKYLEARTPHRSHSAVDSKRS